MMRNKLFVLVIGILWGLNLFAQDNKIIEQIYGNSPIKVVSPVKIDSINIKGEKFTDKDILEMSVIIPEQSEFTQKLDSDDTGFINLQKPSEDYEFQLFSFYVHADRYSEASIKITSPNMLEVYIDGKLSKSKTEKQDSIQKSKDLKAEIKPFPIPNRIVIKLLASNQDNIDPALKIEIERAKDDSLTNFAIKHTDKRYINFTDMMLGNRVSRVSISSNGQYALISYKNTLGEKSVSNTELLEIKTGKIISIDPYNVMSQLSWMPTSEKLYYVHKIDDNTKIVVVDPATMKEEILVKDAPVDAYFSFAPDEKTLFYSKQEKVDDKRGDLKLLKSIEDRKPEYLNRSHVYKFDLKTGLSQQLTFGSVSSWINDISPNSKQVLISFSKEEITERPFRKSTMLLLDLENMNIDTLWKEDGFAGNAIFSPDGKKILISGSGEAFGGIGLNISDDKISNIYNESAFIMDLETKKIETITKNFNPSIDAMYWNKNDGHIYFVTTDKDCQNVYVYNLKSQEFQKLPLEEEIINSFVLSSNSSKAVYRGQSMSNSTRAYVYDKKTQKSTLIADPYEERLSQMELGEINEWNFTNSDGVTIEGRYYLPVDFDPAKKYPLIVYYYGGTTPTPRTFEHPYPGHVFASQGYVVYVVQPSGAIGFGQEFAAMHVNAWGKRTAEDIIEGTLKFVEDNAFIDKDKIGCLGASYGGFMTMYLLTKTDIFAAALSHAGISSISSYWGEGYWGYSYSAAASANSYPWNNRELYVEQSPLFNADKINTPLLITHGNVDTNVPIGESIQMYTALKILGKTVEFIEVKNENHGVANYKRRVEWNNSIMAWFAKWLKNDSNWWDSLHP